MHEYEQRKVLSLRKVPVNLRAVEMATMKRAGRWVADWRKAHGHETQREFAKRAHISPGALQQFETCSRMTRASMFEKIAAGCGKTGEQLLQLAATYNPDAIDTLRDPITADLMPDDIEFARRFARADWPTKIKVMQILTVGEVPAAPSAEGGTAVAGGENFPEQRRQRRHANGE